MITIVGLVVAVYLFIGLSLSDRLIAKMKPKAQTKFQRESPLFKVGFFIAVTIFWLPGLMAWGVWRFIRIQMDIHDNVGSTRG